MCAFRKAARALCAPWTETGSRKAAFFAPTGARVLFRTGAKHLAAPVPRGGGNSAKGAARDATPIFFPEKENGRRPSKRKAFPIAGGQLEELQCLPIALPIARQSRVDFCYTTWCVSIIRCRSAHLVGVQTNFRLPQSQQYGERSNAAFGKQSAAVLPSHAPHDSKARLQNGDE